MTDRTDDEVAPGLPSSAGDAVRLSFGPFSLRNRGEALYRGDEPVRLGNRARLILAVLTRRAGQLVSRADLMAEVWPDTTVAENNLTVHIAALRQALGDGEDGVQYVVNVPGRGYRFVAQVAVELDVERGPVSAPPVSTPTNLPVRLRPAVALSKAIEGVAGKLRSSDVVTVVGPAGVGKTTLALHVTMAERPRHPDGVWLVDLAPLRDAEHIPATIATTMRIELGPGDPTTALVQALSRRKTLLLLDNCEHLIDGVAVIVEMIVRHCAGVALLATSREPLRVSGEALYILAPLTTPPAAAVMSVHEALTYPAVELLVARVGAVTNDFALSDQNVASAIFICHGLDGLPLAIEFASALVGAFGLPGLAARLDDRVKLLQSDVRDVAARHRTLGAALDWSYGLLDPAEQSALQRLAVFAGGFTLEGAAAVIDLHDLGEVGGLLARLHAKSLIANDIAPRDVRFRLLETTRAYALEKLEQTADANEIRFRHAAYHTTLLQTHAAKLQVNDAWRRLIDDVRRALAWALSPMGDIRVGCELVVASAPLWVDLALIPEFHALTQRASQSAASLDPPDPGLEMRLANIRALADLENGVTRASQTALLRALSLAENIGDAPQELIALLGLFQNRSAELECESAAAYAARMRSAAERARHPAPDVVHQSHQAFSLFFLGRSPEARKVADDLLRGPAQTVGPPPAGPFEIDVRISTLTNRARANWVCGFPDRARKDIETALEEAEVLGHLPSLYVVLTSGGPVPLWLRDLPLAERMMGVIRRQADSLKVEHWRIWERSFGLSLAPLLNEPPAQTSSEFVQREMEFLPFARAMACTSHEAHFGPWIDQRMQQNDAVWCREEAYRLRGVRHFQRNGAEGAAESERLIRSALELANRQGALGWALRAAISLCEVLDAAGRREEGKTVLAETYSEFTEGHQTFDLKRARSLLDTP